MATLIYNVTDLQNIQNDLAGDYELANHIDASATSGWNGGLGFIPVGTSASPFTGSLDGKDYTISSLFINRSATKLVGLFGNIEDATIRNVTMAGINITNTYYSVGSIACTAGLIASMKSSSVLNCHVSGSLTASGTGTYSEGVGMVVGWETLSTTIKDCSASGTITGGGASVGGLAGKTQTGCCVENCYANVDITAGATSSGVGGLCGQSRWVINSYATGNVSGKTRVGGLIGRIYSGTFAECYATGIVIGTGDYIGGLMGLVTTGDISDCYARGSVTGVGSVGGLIGNHAGTTTSCYSTGLVTGVSDIGGFCGDNTGTITSCYWDTQTSGQATSAGGTGKTTAEMKQIGTFSGWSIARTALSNPTNGYPFLTWQVDQSTPIWFIYGAGGGITSPRLFVPIEDKVALELLRNVEMSAAGRAFVDKEGYLEYDSRYRRMI